MSDYVWLAIGHNCEGSKLVGVFASEVGAHEAASSYNSQLLKDAQSTKERYPDYDIEHMLDWDGVRVERWKVHP